MDDLELEENQENQAGGDLQALLVLLGQEEMRGHQEEKVLVVLKDLLAAKDHGEKLVNQVRTESMVRQEKGVAQDLRALGENLDSLAQMERLVKPVPRVTRVGAEKRVIEDSRGLMEMMVHQDLAEDLGREVPWETVDQLEDRALQARMAQTVNEDLVVVLDR